MKVKLCPRCGQSFSATAAGLELLYAHLLATHELNAADADAAVDESPTEDRPDPVPRDLPRCH